MLVIGLTGGIGSGKTTVANLFAQRGVPIIDADVIAREVVMPGQAALQAITETFGAEILNNSGQLDRARLRKIVFLDEAKRLQLEAILHPRIRTEIKNRLTNIAAPYCIVAIPLLLETGQRDLVDRLLVVDADPEIQIQRAQLRDNLTKSEVEAVLRTQLSREQRLSQTDDVICNNTSLDDLDEQTQTLHLRYMTLSNAGR